MAISQSRMKQLRGTYETFDKSQALDGEFQVITANDPSVPSGKTVYIAFAPGDVRRLVSIEDLEEMVESGRFDGKDGKDGTSIVILDELSSTSELPLTGNPGDSYLINGDLYTWVKDYGGFKNLGKVQGPQGEQGPEGPQGPVGPQGPEGEKGADGTMSFEDLTEDQREQLKGDKGTTFIPSVDISGNLSWSNTDGMENPESVNIKGPEGPQGEQGIQGQTGKTPNLTIGTVDTLSPDQPATASFTGTTDNPVLNLGIPRGVNGSDGINAVGGWSDTITMDLTGAEILADFNVSGFTNSKTIFYLQARNIYGGTSAQWTLQTAMFNGASQQWALSYTPSDNIKRTITVKITSYGTVTVKQSAESASNLDAGMLAIGIVAIRNTIPDTLNALMFANNDIVEFSDGIGGEIIASN